MDKMMPFINLGLTLCMLSGVLCLYSCLRLRQLFRGRIHIELLVIGSIIFLATVITLIVDAFGFEDTHLRVVSQILWFLAFICLVSGVLMRGFNTSKTYSISLFRSVFLIPPDRFFYAGVTILAFIGLPSIMHYTPFRNLSLSLSHPIHLMGSSFGYLCVAFGAQRFLKKTVYRSSRVETVSDLLLKEDAIIGKMLGTFTNTFLSNMRQSTGAKLIIDVVTEHLENNPMLFEGCEIRRDMSVSWDRILKNIERIHKDERIRAVHRAFLSLNSELIEKWSKITSASFVNEQLRHSYFSTQEHHGNTSNVIYIVRSVPKDFLEEQRLALSTKEELETQVRERTKELEESEHRYRTLVQNLPIAIYRTTPDPKGQFLMANPAFLNMFGFDPEQELKNGAVATLYTKPSDRKIVSDSLMKLGSIEGMEIPLRKKDGTPIWGSVTATSVRDENGEITWFDCAVLDITAQKKAEEEKERLEVQLRHAHKMEAIGTLAGGVAHDFNNLLMGIQGNASLMLLKVDRKHPHYEKLRRIEELVESGTKLTRQLLGYARKGKYEVNPINLNQVVSQTLETFKRTRKDIVVNLELCQDLFTIEADKSQIEQVLFNLYVNAADAMRSGGNLTVTTSNASHEDLPYKIKPGKYAKLTVADTGIGIDSETMERLFEPFFTTKEMGRGTGLGLASAYGIVKAHGGYIDVESEMGRGSIFSVYLPGVGQKTQEEVAMDGQELVNGNETILLVDDEKQVLDVGLELLNALGYKVLGAKSGNEAVKLYESQKDKIDLVILDMVMPGKGGGETYDHLRKINPGVMVLLSSGYSIDGEAREIMNHGCCGFLQKPFTLNELSVKISEILHGKTSAGTQKA